MRMALITLIIIIACSACNQEEQDRIIRAKQEEHDRMIKRCEEIGGLAETFGSKPSRYFYKCTLPCVSRALPA